MTAAGLAFIAGGLATLISFRAVLFGGGDGGERRRSRAATPSGRRRSGEPAHPRRAVPPEPEFPQAAAEPVENPAEPPWEADQPGRRRRLAAAFSGRSAARAERASGLASIGLADEVEHGERPPPEDQDFPYADGEPGDVYADPPAPAADELAYPTGSGEQSWNGEQPWSADESWSGEQPWNDEESWSAEQPWNADESANGGQSWNGEQPWPAAAAWPPEVEAVGYLEEAVGYPEVEAAGYPPEVHEECLEDDPAGEESRFIDSAPWRATPPPEPAVAEDRPAVNHGYTGARPSPTAPIDRSDRGYGDRINGWVRPHYRDLDDRPPSGDYWTPVPGELYADPEPSARGYGWPIPVERLPAVPDYEPATGFDLTPVQAAEPTTLVPSWPPPAPDDRRIRLPRSWATGEQRPRTAPGQSRAEKAGQGRIETAGQGARSETAGQGGRTEKAVPGRTGKAEAEPRRNRDRGPRPRPRPRPAAAAESDSAYISRHAAGPHR